MTSISITSKKHGRAHAVIAPHYGYAAVLLAVAAVVYALGWFAVNVIGAWNGGAVTGTNPYGTVDLKPHADPSLPKPNVAAAPQPAPIPEKIAPVIEPQAPV